MNKGKLNNKGFAISSVLYSLLIMVFLVVTLMMGIMASNRKSTHKLVDTVEEELNRYGLSSTEIGYKDNSGNAEAQEYIALQSGWYKIELWGAAGGSTTAQTGGKQIKGGKGAYTTGLIYLRKDEKLYFYIGGTTSSYKGGTNGGGDGGTETGMGGGGATDVRYGTELETRIMVAAGGGGADSFGKGSVGGNAGIIFGNDGDKSNDDTTYTSAKMAYQEGLTNQTQNITDQETIKKLCRAAKINSTITNYNSCGKLGIGGSASGSKGGGGGAGYFGGGAGTGNSTISGSGAGGSNFILGYSGTATKGVTVDELYYKEPTEDRNYYFIDGAIASNVNDGEGHAKIELVSLLDENEKPRVRNNDLKEVQYIRDCTKGTNDNRKVSSWIELQARAEGRNVTLNSQVTVFKNSLDITSSISTDTLKNAIDNDIKSESVLNVNKEKDDEVCLMINLGGIYNLDEIFVIHKWSTVRSRAVYAHTMEVSKDANTWTKIKSYNDESVVNLVEQSNGIRYTPWSINPENEISTGIYYIRSALGGNGRFLIAQNNNDYAEAETIAERHVSLGNTINGGVNKWAISKLDNGYYKIVEVEGNNALQVKDSLGQENTAVNSAAGHGKDYDWTQWKITSLKDGTYHIQTKVGNNYYLSTAKNSYNEDSDIKITKKGTGNTNYTTRWILELASY